jgi:signal transduction histidine kinase
MNASDMIRNRTSSPVAIQDKPRAHPDRTHPLAHSAESLLDHMQRLRALESADTAAAGPESNAACQWVVDLTNYVVRSAYVGIARVHETTQALTPIAATGSARVDGERWWANLQRALFTRSTEPTTDGQLAQEPFVLHLSSPRTAPARRSQGGRPVCVVPIGVSEELTAIFVVEPRNCSPVLPTDTMTLIRALASVAATTLQAQAQPRTQTMEKTRALREALDAMDGALGLASHELKTPLTTIVICLQLVRSKVESLAQLAPGSVASGKAATRIQDLLALASRQAEILDRITTDLVDASRIRTAKMALHPMPCDLGQIVRESVEGQRVRSPRHIIHLEVPDRRIPVSADPDRVAQVVANFLANALKYSSREQPVEVRVEALKTRTRVSVRDYGPGLEKSELKRVWERFYRVSGVPAHSATGSGLGLGLYIGREIIRGHGGRVGVTSRPGHGATFWFTLPLALSR